MTVPATQRRAGPFTGNGVTTTFPFTFKIFDPTDVRVVVLDTQTAIETDAVLNVDYTVTVNPDQESNPGGSVVFGTAPSTIKTVVLVGNLDLGQPVDLPDGGAYRAQNVEDGLDRLAIQVQQLGEEVDRAVRLAPTSAGASTTLPPPQSVTLLGWDSTASALRNYAAAELGLEVAYATWRTETFNGTGAQTDFVLMFDPANASNIDLTVNGVPQVAGINFRYTRSTKTITFLTGAPGGGTNNVVARYGEALPVGVANAADINYTPAAGPATDVETELRSIDTQLSRFVHVKDFGAVGDGVADDTAEIQAALDANLSVFFGGPGDNYKVSAALVLRNGHYLNLNGATITQATDQTPIFNANSKSGVTITGGRFVGKTEATFTNTPSSQAIAIRADSATDLSVTGNLFENFHYSALMVGTAGTRINFSHNTVIGPGAPVLGVNTNFRNCTGATIIGSDVRIHGNSIRAVAQGLIVGQGSNQVTITGNVISALVNEHGMYIDTGVRKLAIIGNIVQGTGVFGMGIKVQYYNSFGVTPDAIVISDNVISDAQQDGILVDNTDVSPTIRAVGVTISGNTILNAGAYGIDVRDAVDCTVANNTIVNPQQCGIALDNAASVLVEGNLIRGAVRSGIRDLSACSSVRILNNMIRDCATGNVANDEYGILISFGSEYVISGNIIQDSAANMQYGLFIGSPVNATLTLTDNTVVGMSDTGIRFDATTGLREYRRNNFNGNIAATFNDPLLPSVASASTITLPTAADVVQITGTTTINTITANGHSGRRVTLLFSDALTVARATGNIILNQSLGNFSTTGNDTLTLVCNSASWYEVSRSAN